MKTKIISIALLLVMILCTLTGCAYNYEKKDLSDYATIDGVTLKAALDSLVIEDGDFTSVEATRKLKVYAQAQENYGAALAAISENKLTSGTITEGDYVTYCFYTTAEVDSETKFFNGSKMLTSESSTITLVNDGDEINNAIRAGLKDYDLTEAYNAVATGTVVAGKKALVSYKETVGGTTHTYSYMLVDVKDEANTLGQYLIGKSFGTQYATEATSEENDQKVVCGESIYSYIKVLAQIDAGAEKVITLRPYTENASFTDNRGQVVNVTPDTEVQYHVYVMNYVAVSDFKTMYETSANETVKAIIFDILGDDITTKDLDIFTDEQYYYEENDTKTTLSDLISGLVTKYSTLSTAQSAYDKVMEDEEADQATKDEKLNALNAAKAALDRDTIVTEINKCYDVTEPETNMAGLIAEAYVQSIYDELESDYESEIAEKIIAAVDAKIKSLMTVTGAPKQAVKNAYKTNRANYKYTFYTGSNDDSESYTDVYETFDAYLEAVASTLKGSTVTGKAAVKEVLMEEATADVKELVQVYVLAKAVNDAYGLTGDEKITVTKDDINYYASYMASYYYYIYQQQFSTDAMIEMFGEDNIRAYYLLDRTMGFLVEADADAEGPKVAFKHVKYEFKTNDVN